MGVCVNAIYCCILGLEGPQVPQALPHRSPSRCPQRLDRRLFFQAPPSCRYNCSRGHSGFLWVLSLAVLAPCLLRLPCVSWGAGAVGGVGSGSAPARSQSCPKTCFEKLCPLASVSSVVLVHRARSGHGTGDPLGAVVPRGLSGPGLLLPLCLLALPGCGQELGRVRGGLCSASPWISCQPFPRPRFLICVASDVCDPTLQQGEMITMWRGDAEARSWPRIPPRRFLEKRG